MSRNSAVAAMTAMKKIKFQGTQTLQKRNTLAREGQTKNKEAEGLPGCPCRCRATAQELRADRGHLAFVLPGPKPRESQLRAHIP